MNKIATLSLTVLLLTPLVALRSALLAIAIGVLFIVPANAQTRSERKPSDARSRSERKPSGNKSQKQDQPTVETVTVDGIVEAVGPQGFTAKSFKERKAAKGRKGSVGHFKEWLISSTSNTTWLVTGTAKLSYLRDGQLVVFTAELDDKLQPKDQVSTLAIVAGKEYKPGITVDDGSGPLKPNDPGIPGGAPANKPAKKIDAKDIAPAGKVKVTGRISSLSGSHFTVRAGDKMVHARLDDNPTIDIVINATCEPKLLRDSNSKLFIGSKVTVHGRAAEYKQGATPNCLQADNIKVMLLLPLEGKAKLATLKTPLPAEKADAEKSGTDEPSADADGEDDQPKDKDAPARK